MSLFNSLKTNGKKNSVELSSNIPFPSQSIAHVFKYAEDYYLRPEVASKERFIYALQVLFIEHNQPVDDIEQFADEAFERARQSCARLIDYEAKMLHFKTSIIRSLNKELETNIEFPLITYLRELCITYQSHLKRDLPTEINEDDRGSECSFETKRLITEHKEDDSSFISLTKSKFALINETRQKHFGVINIPSSNSGFDLENTINNGWGIERDLYDFGFNTSSTTDQDQIIRDFEQDLIHASSTFTKTRDPWYIELVKQLFSLGFINLYRDIYKGNITRGDKFFNEAQCVLSPEEQVIESAVLLHL